MGIIDFPIVEYQLEMAESCLSQLGTRRLHQLRVKEGLSPLPNAQILHSLCTQKDTALPALAPTPATEPAAPENRDKLSSTVDELEQGVSELAASVAELQVALQGRA